MMTTFKPGDRVRVKDDPCRWGVVQFTEGFPEAEAIWVELFPGAMGGYQWVSGHFPLSSSPDRIAIHAFNRFTPGQLTPDAPE